MAHGLISRAVAAAPHCMRGLAAHSVAVRGTPAVCRQPGMQEPDSTSTRLRLAAFPTRSPIRCASGDSSTEAANQGSGKTSRLSKLLTPDEKLQAGARKILAERQSGKDWWSAARQGAKEWRAKNKDESFANTVKNFCQIERFDFKVMREQLDEAIRVEERLPLSQRIGLKIEKMRGGEQGQAIEEMQATMRQQIAIIDALTAVEKRRISLIDKVAKKRVMDQLGLESEDPIDELVSQYSHMKMQWEFFRREYLAGNPLPQNSADMEWMLRLKPTKTYSAMMRQNQIELKKLGLGPKETAKERHRRKAEERWIKRIPMRKWETYA
mmetsp:Transcript_784/g.1452  ORF Transcript_784/g.1452 Transcript_784/m.1452 type:complete len:325 (-) Transcript_784:488-1462(-)